MPRHGDSDSFNHTHFVLSGKVLYPQSAGDKETEVLKQLNDRVQTDPRVENILLTVRDGLMMCVKLLTIHLIQNQSKQKIVMLS